MHEKGTMDHSDPVPTPRWTRVDYEGIKKGGTPHQSPTPPLEDSRRTTQDDRYASPEYHLLKLRSTSTPTQLRTKDRKAVIKFYNAFINFLKQYRVPVKTFDQVRIEHLEDPAATIYPSTMEADSQLYTHYSAAIYARLEEDGVLDPSEPVYRGLLQMYNRTRDGYRLLKSLLAATLMVDAKNISQLSTPPPVDSTIHPYEYASQLQKFFQFQMEQKRHYTEREQAMMFLQGMQQVRMYAAAATQLMHDLEQHPLVLGTVPHKFVFPALPITLASHPAALSMPPTHPDTYTPARLNVTRAHADSNPRPYPSTRNIPARTRRSSTGTRPPPKDTQCSACATYGHEVADCKVLPKVAACIEYQQTHTSMVQTAMQRYRKSNHPTNRHSRQHTREVVANKLHGHLIDSDNIDLDELVDDITDSLYGYDDEEYDTNAASLYQLHATTHAYADLHTYHSVIQPAKFPLFEQVRAETQAHSLHEDTRNTPTEDDPSSTRVTVSVSAIQQRDLADTGASVSATGLRQLLHDFTTDTRYEITGYDGNVTKAAGEGYAHVRNHDTKMIDKILFVYAPNITGTIFSLEHHAQTHPQIHRWSQEAIPSTHGGWITFYGHDDSVISRYPTIRSKGVYYIQDMKFIPVHEHTASNTAQDQQPTRSDTHEAHHQLISSLQATEPRMVDFSNRGDLMVDFSNRGDLVTLTEQVPIPPATPNVTPLLHTVSTQTMTKLESDILNYEIWHQRMAHCSEGKMRKTQKHVDGIPTFHSPEIPSVIRCRACDVATLKRAPRGPPTLTSNPIQPGQTFQMDLGFFRGPSNLVEVYDRKATPLPKLIESRQGFVCYLLIIDRCTRYIWIFPLRSKSVPPDLIKIFLQTHGNQNRVVKTLRTDGEGSLAESPKFRGLIAAYGYTLEKTATDTSSQNGLAERPHRTMSEMSRCLLYSAAMPIYFWADAIVYAGYIYNRLYHEGVHGVPYNLWTGKRANVKHLRAFGARVLVKRSGHRPTKADPHHYDGRFLRFGATDRNLIYFDEVTQREKIARHCTIDEFHYDSPLRPPGATQVLEQVTPHFMHRQHPPKETCYLRDDRTATDTSCTPLDTMDPNTAELHQQRHPQTAVAAMAVFDQLSRQERQFEEILHSWTDTNEYLPPVSIRLPINKHPTLGFVLTDDTDNCRVYLQGCQEGTTASRLPRWRSTIRHSILRTLNGTQIRSTEQVRGMLNDLRRSSCHYADFVFARIEPRAQPDTDIPHLHFEQLRHLNQIQIEMKREQRVPIADVYINLTRTQLKKREDYDMWRKAEWTQHDKYKAQGMFGKPILRPHNATVLPWVWTYMMKENPLNGEPIYKARGTCNGGKRYGKAVTLAETYATCVEQPACRLYWSLTASEGLLAIGADAGNAFAEAPPPVQPFYMAIDAQFLEWWMESEKNPPLPDNHVLPVQHALQGHPEAGRLWEQHIHTILTAELKFRSTTHEKCLYSRTDSETNRLNMLLRQVDDFSVSAQDTQACNKIIGAIGKYLKVPLNDLGLIRKFNGVNVMQTRWYIKISCQDYLLKILDNHGWLDLQASNQPIPMRQDPAYHRQLELADRPESPQQQQQIQTHAGFSYRAAVGELIYALVIARPEISVAITKLSQYGTNPASIHYQAVKMVFAFLNNTREDGLIYWRRSPRMDLPEAPFPSPHSTSANALPPIKNDPGQPIAFSDSDWGSDFSHRRSISGMIIMLSGAAIVYKTRYQKAVALSSTEAEFVAAADTGKMILYIRSLLSDLGLPQSTPTKLYIDNTGAVFMVEAQASPHKTNKACRYQVFCFTRLEHHRTIDRNSHPNGYEYQRLNDEGYWTH